MVFFFIPFAPIAEPQFIIPTMASALRLNFFGESEPKEQLLDYLRHKDLLLVLDNFEHLLAGAGLLSEILGRAAHVVVLATSRERFNLREEWVFEVGGLSYPLENSPGADPRQLVGFAERHSAVNLFLQRSRQRETAFNPTADDLAAIVRICRLVEGMPLGLELAASWTRTLSCGEIAAEIENSIDFLTTSLRNIPQRHRSLVALFEQTWDRLTHNEQQVLNRLAVFRGGCTREAAQTVTGAALTILSSLIDKALLRRTNTGRFEQHELIRQFAQSKLETDARALERIQQRHRDFFTNFLAARTEDVKGRRQGEALAEIEADLDNVRLAWRGAAADQDVEAIERSADCLFVYYLYRNGYDEGQTESSPGGCCINPLDRSAADGWPNCLRSLSLLKM